MFTEKLKDKKLRQKYLAFKEGYKKLMSGESVMDESLAEINRDKRILTVPNDRVIRVDENVKVDNIPVPLEVVERFIRKSSYRFIQNFCPCREFNDCKDYPIGKGCLFLGQAAKDIDPELGRLVSVEEALEYVWGCKKDGLVTILGYAPLDAIAHEVGPANRLMLVCACCPCCCMTPMTENTGRRMPGIEVRIKDSCTGCGSCLDVCFYKAMEMNGDKAQTTELCTGCGRCVEACPEDAIDLTIVDSTYIERTEEILCEKVDVT